MEWYRNDKAAVAEALRRGERPDLATTMASGPLDELVALHQELGIFAIVDELEVQRARAGVPDELLLRTLAAAVSAVGTLVGSGLFEVVVLDLAGVPAAARQRLPGTTWIRLHRLVEDQPTALLLVADGHVAHSPCGATLAMKASAPRWAGAPPARVLRGVQAEVREARRSLRGAALELQACS